MTWVKAFQRDETGAVTVDWVVMTAAVVGLGMATLTQVSGGTGNISSDIATALRNQMSTSTNYEAAYFYAIGIAAHGDNKTDAWRAAREAVAEEAPGGYEYDPGFETTRYVDNATGYPIYVSDDGQSYSIGGNVVSAADYDNTNRKTFISAFGDAWDEV